MRWYRDEVEGNERRLELVRVVLAELDAVLETRAFELSLDEPDSDELPPNWYWRLEQRGPDTEGDDSDPEDGMHFRAVDRVDRAAMESLTQDALAGRGAAIMIDSVTLETRTRRLPEASVEVNIWFLSEPSVELEWQEAGGEPARPDVDRIIERLRQLGWVADSEAPVDDADDREAEASAPAAPMSSTEGADGHIMAEEVAIELDWPRGGKEPAERAATAVEAMRLFTIAAEPCALDLTTGFEKRRGREDRPRRFLWRMRQGPEPGGSILFGMVTRTVTSLEPEGISAFVREALLPQRPGGLFGWLRKPRPVDWTMLSAALMRVEMPGADRAGRDALVLDCPGGPVRATIRRNSGRALVEPLADAPDDVADSAVEMQFISGVTLLIRIYWSPWAEPGSPGRQVIDRAVARLVQHGWTRPERVVP